jgi:NADPH2:quinone reductase
MLQTRVFSVDDATTALVHSAAGGLGSLLVRAAKQRGATVIATVGSPAKAAIARAAGADHVIVGRDADFAAAVHELTGGAGVDVAYDGVGGTTLAKTLACVRPFGTVASFGEAGGPIPPLPVEDIGPQRSLMLARPSVMRFMADRDAYVRAARAVVAAAQAPDPGPAYPLAEAARAHCDLEAGATTGAAVLIP